jgi:hypothetical protein
MVGLLAGIKERTTGFTSTKNGIKEWPVKALSKI